MLIKHIILYGLNITDYFGASWECSQIDGLDWTEKENHVQQRCRDSSTLLVTFHKLDIYDVFR